MCGPALTWGLYGVGRDSAGMGTRGVAAQRRAPPLVIRWALRVARGSPRGRVRGGFWRVFWLPFFGQLKRGARGLAPRWAASMCTRGVGAADSRALLSPGCCCVARSIVVDRGSQTTVPALARPSNSSQVYVSRFRRACLADRAPNIFFWRAKFELVLLNASSACRGKARLARPVLAFAAKTSRGTSL